MKVVFHIINHARKEVCHLRFVHREGIQTNAVSCGTRSVSSGVTRPVECLGVEREEKRAVGEW